MRVEPVSEDVLVDRVVERVLAVGRERPGAVRLLVDGHPSTRPEDLADRLVARRGGACRVCRGGAADAA